MLVSGSRSTCHVILELLEKRKKRKKKKKMMMMKMIRVQLYI